MENSAIPEDQVAARAEKLIHEFVDHFNECIEHDPSVADRKGDVFEAWAIQKLAGLQLAVEHLADHCGIGLVMSGGNGGNPEEDVPF
jgi:hypothetical protein